MASDPRRAAGLALATLLALGAAAPARAQAGAVCEPGARGGAVALIILNSGRKVHEYAASVRDGTIVRRDTSTVVFGDGRVVTSDVAAASRHLNALGWGDRSIEVVASFSSRSRAPRRRGFG